MSAHHISRADTIYKGDAYYEKSGNDDSRRGGKVTLPFAVQFGAVAAADDDGIAVGATTTGAGSLSTTGALVSGGVATMDVPRSVSITSTGDLSGLTFSFTMTDDYGEAVTEDITGPNNSTVYGVKAVKTVTGVTTTGAVSVAVNIGSADILGFPYRVDKGDVLAVTVDGSDTPTATAAHTITAGLSTTGTSTATTADIRGTIAPNVSPDGTKVFTVLIAPDFSTKAALYGVDQA